MTSARCAFAGHEACAALLALLLKDFGAASRQLYDARETERIYDSWWSRPGTLEDYSNPQLQRAYTQNLLFGRVANDLEYLELACTSQDGVDRATFGKQHTLYLRGVPPKL